MAEPIVPEAYLAIATSVHNIVSNYRDKKQAEQNDKLTIVTTESSKSSLTLPADELLSYSGLKIDNDGYVQWVMDNPAHPKNWSRKRKFYDFGSILVLEFIMSGVSAAGIPASLDGLKTLGHGREVGLVAFTTMYLLGQALGALLLSPYSGNFGRRTLYIGSAFLYSIFCLPVAATPHIAGVFVGRFITGLISAIPAITTRLSLDDLFDTEGRMWAFFSWALVTNLGLVLGPVYASYVSTSLNWRWPFYLATIIVAATGILTYFIRESHASHLLKRKVAAIQSLRADLILQTSPAAPRPSFYEPMILLSTNPLIFLSSLANAFTTALLYLFAVAFPLIYAHYAWTTQKTTLIFLFTALGLLFSTLTRLHDRHTTRKYPLTNHRFPPETSLFGLAIGAPTLAAALWWFAWTIPGTHVTTISWPASALSLIPLGYGINEHSTTLPRYLLESNPQTSASAFTALLATRALLSAIFPLFTTHMFENLGHNVAGSILAAIATALSLLPFILIKFADMRSRDTNLPPTLTKKDEESLPEILTVKNEKKKPRKSVRWDDETDATPPNNNNNTTLANSPTTEKNPPDSASTEEDSSSSSSIISTAETKPSPHDFASADDVADSALEMMMMDNGTGSTDSDSNNDSKNEKHDSKKSNPNADDTRESAEGAGKETPGSRSHTAGRRSRSNIRSSSSGSRRSRRRKSSSSAKGNKNKNKKREEKMRNDDGDNGAVGLWGLGMDVERVVIFPYFF